ncbi:MAG: hypothetical protein CO095_04765, partial [Armatimonadetes bacterium CG_4_9_14_3_um_filter_58_7]
MTDFLLSQIIAAIAFACGVISFQSRTRRTILLWLCGSAIANACHFFILGGTAPGTLFLIIGARSAVAAFTVNRRVLSLFIGLILVSFLFSYNGPLGFPGLFASLSATYGSFQKSERRVRVFHMLSNASWMVHNILVRVGRQTWRSNLRGSRWIFNLDEYNRVLAFPPHGHSLQIRQPESAGRANRTTRAPPDGMPAACLASVGNGYFGSLDTLYSLPLEVFANSARSTPRRRAGPCMFSTASTSWRISARRLTMCPSTKARYSGQPRKESPALCTPT